MATTNMKNQDKTFNQFLKAEWNDAPNSVNTALLLSVDPPFFKGQMSVSLILPPPRTNSTLPVCYHYYLRLPKSTIIYSANIQYTNKNTELKPSVSSSCNAWYSARLEDSYTELHSITQDHFLLRHTNASYHPELTLRLHIRGVLPSSDAGYLFQLSPSVSRRIIRLAQLPVPKINLFIPHTLSLALTPENADTTLLSNYTTHTKNHSHQGGSAGMTDNSQVQSLSIEAQFVETAIIYIRPNLSSNNISDTITKGLPVKTSHYQANQPIPICLFLMGTTELINASIKPIAHIIRKCFLLPKTIDIHLMINHSIVSFSRDALRELSITHITDCLVTLLKDIPREIQFFVPEATLSLLKKVGDYDTALPITIISDDCHSGVVGHLIFELERLDHSVNLIELMGPSICVSRPSVLRHELFNPLGTQNQYSWMETTLNTTIQRLLWSLTEENDENEVSNTLDNNREPSLRYQLQILTPRTKGERELLSKLQLCSNYSLVTHQQTQTVDVKPMTNHILSVSQFTDEINPQNAISFNQLNENPMKEPYQNLLSTHQIDYYLTRLNLNNQKHSHGHLEKHLTLMEIHRNDPQMISIQLFKLCWLIDPMELAVIHNMYRLSHIGMSAYLAEWLLIICDLSQWKMSQKLNETLTEIAKALSQDAKQALAAEFAI